MPEPFNAVGLWYDEFGQTSDEEVARLLAAAGRTPARLALRGHPSVDAVDVVRAARGRSWAIRRSTTSSSRGSATRVSCCSAKPRTARTSSTASARSSRGG